MKLWGTAEKRTPLDVGVVRGEDPVERPLENADVAELEHLETSAEGGSGAEDDGEDLVVDGALLEDEGGEVVESGESGEEGIGEEEVARRENRTTRPAVRVVRREEDIDAVYRVTFGLGDGDLERRASARAR